MLAKKLNLLLVCSCFSLLTACTEPGETTSIGAATGGVIGAGLGAIVGHQSGDAGSGLVIGSLAGAGAGAAIGNSLEAQQKSIRTQDEALERQQKLLAAQSAEIRELRNMPGDQSTSARIRGALDRQEQLRRPSTTSDLNSLSDSTKGGSYTEELNRGAADRISAPRSAKASLSLANSNISSTLPNNKTSSLNSLPSRDIVSKDIASSGRSSGSMINNSGMVSNSRAMAREIPLTDNSRLSQSGTMAQNAPSKVNNKGALSLEDRNEAAEMRASLKKDKFENKIETSPSFSDPSFSEPSFSEKDISAALNDKPAAAPVVSESVEEIADEAPPILAKRVPVGKNLDSPECFKANAEADKASSSKEPADKLFYFRRAIRLCPGNASFHKQLADEYAQLGRNEDAKASYQEALKLDPSMSEARSSISTISSNAY